MIITFTGHRPNKINDYQEQKKVLLKIMLKRLLDLKDHSYRVGGCPGFDTMALALLLQQGVDPRSIILMVPFVGFEMYATKDDYMNKEVMRFNEVAIKKGVKLIEFNKPKLSFTRKCYIRNEALCMGESKVEKADIIFTNWNGSKGGTCNTVGIAKQLSMEIINVTE